MHTTPFSLFGLSLSVMTHDVCLDVSLFQVFNVNIVIATTPIYIPHNLIYIAFIYFQHCCVHLVFWLYNEAVSCHIDWKRNQTILSFSLSICLLPLSLHDYSFFSTSLLGMQVIRELSLYASMHLSLYVPLYQIDLTAS